MVDHPDTPLALVTGAQRGIGEAIARALSIDGFDVVIVDQDIKHSAARFKERWGSTRQISCLCTDITDESQVDDLFADVIERYQRAPTVLINNAALQVWAPLLDVSLSDWQAVLNVNLTGTFLMTQRFARARQNTGGGGVIINLGSGCNRLAFPMLAAYVTSKGGIEMLTKASALELGKLGIRVNCVAPGAIETERTLEETDQYADSWSPLTPLGRVGTVNDVAQTVVALTSDRMRFVSGETIHVDGGLFSRAVWPEEY